ncbi:MAG: dienelactone hydrolase family protein [Isosphaeraceae bacterium]
MPARTRSGSLISMRITTESVDLTLDESPLRMLVARPKEEGTYPGVLFYSDIFQLTPTMARATARLAGYGFVVAAPEIYHRIEPPGTAIPFDDEGRTRGLDDAAKTAVAEFDATAAAVIKYLGDHPAVDPARRFAAGFCIGGHLAFRAALHPDVKATACFYPTGVHNGKLGRDADAGSLARAGEIRGRLLLVFGTLDPHVPPEARAAIDAGLKAAGTNVETKLYPGEHAFMRDEGPRYDPEITDLAWADMIALFRST